MSHPETDDLFRKRILDVPVNRRNYCWFKAHVATGTDLDAIAETHGMKRGVCVKLEPLPLANPIDECLTNLRNIANTAMQNGEKWSPEISIKMLDIIQDMVKQWSK